MALRPVPPGGGKRASLRLIDYWPLVPCITFALWAYQGHR